VRGPLSSGGEWAAYQVVVELSDSEGEFLGMGIIPVMEGLTGEDPIRDIETLVKQQRRLDLV
jgi:hypothetical protein